MWKLVIADDEPKIRRGLKTILNWNEYEIEIVGEAEDGEIALNIIKEREPDIILLDINMPFLNGLDLLKEIRKINIKCIVIIISGYDEFSYAQEALKLNVFNYILKPVNKDNMGEIIKDAVEKLKSQFEEKKYKVWIEKQLNENMYDMKKRFFCDFLDNKLSDDDVLKEMKYFEINLEGNIGMIIIKIIDKSERKGMYKGWDSELLIYAVCNLLNDKFKYEKDKFIFKDNKSNIIILLNVEDRKEWIEVRKELQEEIERYLKCNVVITQVNSYDGILNLKDKYKNALLELNDRKRYSPIVLRAIDYIEKNYYMSDLTINKISDKLEISSSYLSKILKKETGFSFIDYLTHTRIEKSMNMMEDPTIRIYDVAELVGYSNQHYFCRAFKKLTGVSPSEYKRRR